MKTRAATLDYAAVTLSSLCIIHCLLLPVLAVSIPVAGVVSESEWLHRTFVILAVPLSMFVFFGPMATSRRWSLRGLAMAGCAFLILGAFVEALHDYEVGLTVAGAMLQASAHLVRLFLRPHRH